MKILHIADMTPVQLNWLMGAIESTQSGNTDNAKFKGRLLVQIAELMEEQETAPEKPNLKEIKK